MQEYLYVLGEVGAVRVVCVLSVTKIGCAVRVVGVVSVINIVGAIRVVGVVSVVSVVGAVSARVLVRSR